MVLNREEAAKVAERTKKNKPGMCQLVTRGYYDALSVGDLDGDGRADAEDGWKSEPAKARHTDRKPPRGVPVSFTGGRNDDGHRAISVGGSAPIRSTDFDGRTRKYKAGVVGNGTIAEIEKALGVKYAGWSETISGKQIPLPPKVGPMTRGARVDAALKRLRQAEKNAKNGTARDKKIRSAIRDLKSLKAWRKK